MKVADWELYRARTEGRMPVPWAVEVMEQYLRGTAAKPASSSEDAKMARYVRSARAYAGLTQRALAEAIGVSQALISRVEGGRRRLRASEAKAIADALEMPVDRLLDPVWERR